mmetsp:Transcript_84089/g.148675  ORF Transcript_84089/g.148675 Transcript_84089/m.148675 type:complete len:87 (+) Transcript_84089:59-319(+)
MYHINFELLLHSASTDALAVSLVMQNGHCFKMVIFNNGLSWDFFRQVLSAGFGDVFVVADLNVTITRAVSTWHTSPMSRQLNVEAL